MTIRFFTRTFLLFIIAVSAKAQSPGMWLPNDIDSTAWANMKATGLDLTKQDLYNESGPSLKDAIVQFGGGCTSEFVSAEGLLFTNHHCGLGNVQRLSSIENDYLQTGFWARNRADEKPCEGLSVTRIVRIQDMTDRINAAPTPNLTDQQRARRTDSLSLRVVQEATTGTHYAAFVRPFYNGNEHVLFITETFRDVRLVGAPPMSLGNFGGDTDNWVWPRHTADFMVFRVYAGADNKPADYNAANVPYKPLKHLPVSAKGVSENDFTMVYGFPGRTTQYLPATAVELVQNVTNPIRIDVRTARLNAWQQAMRANDTVRIQYQSKYNGLANGWKKWQGEVKGLKETNAVGWKQQQEKEFAQRAASKNQYTNLLPQLNATYDSMKTVMVPAVYQAEALEASELFDLAEVLAPVVEVLKDKNAKINFDSLKLSVQKGIDGFYKDYNAAADRAAYAAAMNLYAAKVPADQRVPYVTQQLGKSKNDMQAYMNNLYAKSMLDDQTHMRVWAKNLKRGSETKIEADPVYKLWQNLNAHYQTNLSPTVNRLSARANLLNREYMKAQMELVPERVYFPDANSTLRVTYGKVAGYQPNDGMRYNWFTTADGILEKHALGVYDYVLRDDYKMLLQSREYGAYATNNELHTGFIATNHTTGGNSGSPVINGRGELVGINFDRVWEGTMSDIRFMNDRCRNISVDTRYILFVIDKYGGAGYLLSEMDIRK
ncbi:MAG TPA: S46 family peptidase [Chitinophagales bacterium]|nr:S46 family peptidase [Chitinophagales bacterium]